MQTGRIHPPCGGNLKGGRGHWQGGLGHAASSWSRWLYAAPPPRLRCCVGRRNCRRHRASIQVSLRCDRDTPAGCGPSPGPTGTPRSPRAPGAHWQWVAPGVPGPGRPAAGRAATGSGAPAASLARGCQCAPGGAAVCYCYPWRSTSSTSPGRPVTPGGGGGGGRGPVALSPTALKTRANDFTAPTTEGAWAHLPPRPSRPAVVRCLVTTSHSESESESAVNSLALAESPIPSRPS